MSIQKEDVINNLKEKRHWLRVLTMLVYAAVYGLAELVVILVVLIQWGTIIATGGKNQNLLSLGQSLSAYLYQILRYLTYNTEEKPFPFSSWPNGESPSHKPDLHKSAE